MSEQEPQEPPAEHEHKWVQQEKKIYDPTKGPDTRNAHVVTKIIYVCETCGKRKIERDKPVIDTEKETVFM
jgi:hypothetical protein